MTAPTPGIPELSADVVLWSADEPDRVGRPLLVLLHGYGADERDLFGLTPYLPDEFVIAAPRAPLAPSWPAPGYSWYPIDGFEPGEDLGGRSPQPTTDAASALIAWLDVVAGYASAIGLLGFSQGAAVAIQALRLQPERFSFVVNLSGYATPGALPRDAELAKLEPPVFWGRGTRDDVIPEALVAHTTEWLPQHADLSGRVYHGLTHSVSEPELDDVRAFLEKQLEDHGAAADSAPPTSIR
ncbi:alpha/beta hydrolase [uncultured Microbacterium sp.]|uniref:alpha/beta hydrolase n=1 Tax=uncultured Microbacterium sp. TaxID=191216 RepID=UPI0035C9FA7B